MTESITNSITIFLQRAEQRTTVQNSDGSQSTTVTRRIGEREYITTTKIFGNGEKEVHEELVNMDETESGRFNAEWSSPTATRNALKQNLEHDQQMDNRRMGPLLDPKGPGLFSRLFKSWWWGHPTDSVLFGLNIDSLPSVHRMQVSRSSLLEIFCLNGWIPCGSDIPTVVPILVWGALSMIKTLWSESSGLVRQLRSYSEF